MDGDAVNGAVGYDVPQRRLELAGVTLSRRMENGKGVWRLEAPRLQGEEPLVVEQAGGPVTPPRDVTAVLPAFLRGSSVEQVQPGPEVRKQVRRRVLCGAPAVRAQNALVMTVGIQRHW